MAGTANPPVDPELVQRAWSWVAADPDPTTREELDAIIEAAEGGDPAAAADLAERFAADLDFGTAGLRGALGAGPNRMNLAVVTRAANGIVSWLRSDGPADAAARGVVVCFDARHRSADFATRSAAIFAEAGIRAHLLPGPLPTPVLAFAVRHLGAAAGVMVTASHNPPQDNGYKVYDGTGRQIVGPFDAIIAAAIDATPRAVDVRYADDGDPDIVHVGDELLAAYVAGASQVGLVPEARSVRVAYTAMHGVGAATFRRVFEAAGFEPAHEVAEQVEPDPDFPTVAFPNPEEPGALDLGLATARRVDAQVLIANDPDADRLGAAVPDPGSPGGWRALRGDEIGAVLADHLLSNGGIAPGATLATTIVSSTLLGKMAAAVDVRFVETLTGFKWVCRAAGPHGHLGFGYEEALGFCIGDLVHDKDGITAAVVFAEAVAALADEGLTVLDVLDELAIAHGVHQTTQWSVRIPGADAMEVMAAAMHRMRTGPPTELAGRPVIRTDDLIDGDAGRGFVPSDVLIWHLDGARVVVRPSGTEPKLKAYVEVVEPVESTTELPEVRARAVAEVQRLVDAVAAATGLT
ncbi:phospho-sugar mutase [Aquihabitans sp. McL0605]|uniref:phospho-sugar mutase n=1 Tax=Aquihabitans sp. McL0605 TaxID=3415671 RepID=UPI003CEA9292